MGPSCPRIASRTSQDDNDPPISWHNHGVNGRAWDLIFEYTGPVLRSLSGVTRALYVMTPILAVVGLIGAATDEEGGWALLMVAPLVLAAVYPTLETLWRRYDSLQAVILVTAAVGPLLPGIAATVLLTIVYLLPPVQAAAPGNAWLQEHPALLILVAYIVGLLGALAVWILIVMPFGFLFRPRRAGHDNALRDGSPASRLELVATWVMLIAVFGFATGMTLALWWLAILSVVLIVLCTILIFRARRAS